MPLLLQGIGDILGHVVLVVFGEHGVSLENAGSVERTFGNHALPFAEQVGQNSLIGNRQRRAAVGDLESNLQIFPAHERARLHQAAEPEPLARLNVFFRHHLRCRKEND